jgi:hypothetical protein
LPPIWFCAYNPDTNYNSCSKAQQNTDGFATISYSLGGKKTKSKAVIKVPKPIAKPHKKKTKGNDFSSSDSSSEDESSSKESEESSKESEESSDDEKAKKPPVIKVSNTSQISLSLKRPLSEKPETEAKKKFRVNDD